MELAAFLVAIQRRTRFTSTARDPLAAAHAFLDKHGKTAEAEALRRVIKALARRHGKFSESDIWLFSTETLTLISALADARVEGLYPELDWWVEV